MLDMGIVVQEKSQPSRTGLEDGCTANPRVTHVGIRLLPCDL